MFSESELQKYNNKDTIIAFKSKMDAFCDKCLKKFQDLQEEIEENLGEIKKANLASESNKNINHLHRYMSKLTEEKIGLYKLSQEKDKIEGELYDYFRNHCDISSKLRSEAAIAKYVEAHPCYQLISKSYNVQDNIVKYLENIVVLIRDRGFAIKNIIEITKIELGML